MLLEHNLCDVTSPLSRHPSTIRFSHFSTIVTFPPTNDECQRTSAVEFWPAWEFHVDKEADRETTENKESAAWRQVLSYKSLSATKAVFFFQGQIHLEAPVGRKMLPSSAILSVMTDSWSELNPAEMIHQGCLHPILWWPQTSRPFCMQTPLNYNNRKHNWCVQHYKWWWRSLNFYYRSVTSNPVIILWEFILTGNATNQYYCS